ncbi:hypothetical protein L484_011814 [Morus notabilis]|uniref:Peroxisome biogenesis protein 19-1 n=1 Tax=Morus notabilis TaxID=981085 RepID=W9S6F3_9ROSA|nr:hypothetical protein L484_011814 [Morus notabilis]
MAADHHNDDLDELLDSALDDFHNLNLNNVQRRGGGGEEEEGRTLSGVQGLGLGLGLPDLKSKKKKGKQREKAPKKEKEKEKEKESHVSEALDQLRAQTREAVKGLESVTATSNPNADDAIMEDWVKQFEELAGSQCASTVGHVNCEVPLDCLLATFTLSSGFDLNNNST